MSPQSTILNDWSDFWFDGVGVNVIPVSYTHLTLPTILLV